MDILLGALSILLFEAARTNAAVAQLRALLNEQGVSGENADMILALYEEHKSTFVDHMATTGISVPSIVDITWRLDYSVRSKYGGRDNTPSFFVSLTVKDRGLLRNIDILASHEELQDMLSKVKDAVKQVDRVLIGSEK